MKKVITCICSCFLTILTSCSLLGRFRLGDAFQVLESEDGIFKTYANYHGNDGSFFYSSVKARSENILLYCVRIEAQSSRFGAYAENNKYNSVGVFEPNIVYDKNTANISLNSDYIASIDDSLLNWSSIVKKRDALDTELDAKYYTDSTYEGINGELVFEFVPWFNGYLIDEQGNKEYNQICFDKSSIFSFKLLGYYRGEELVLNFLDENSFSIKTEDKMFYYGNYSSNRTGFSLRFMDEALFGVDNIELKINPKSNFISRHFATKEVPWDIDIEKYMSSDYEFWIQQYDAENP